MCFDSVGSDYFDFSKNLFLRSFALSSVWDELFVSSKRFISTEKAAFWSKFSNEVFDRFGILYCTVLYVTAQEVYNWSK